MGNSLPTLEQSVSSGCYFTRLEYTAQWEQYFLLISDIHWDAKGCNRKLIRKHLEQAKARNAPVFIFGDLLDLMGGKHDPRSAKHQLRAEYAGSEDYLGNVCEDAADFLAPYVDNIALISLGNHEHSYQKHHEISPLTIVATHLKSKTGKSPIVAPYTGWIQFKMKYANGGRRKTINMKYHHGVGGNAPVTKGAIQSNRSAVMWPNADIMVRGHIHNRFAMHMPVETISSHGRIMTDQERVYLQTGCYVSDIEDGNSWSSMRGFGVPAMGGYWLRLYNDNLTENTVSVQYQAIPTD
jgi:hypothetical protein